MLLALYPIPILTICIVGFIVVFTYRLRKTSGDQREIERRFWERERKANATRRRDISNLEYINIDRKIDDTRNLEYLPLSVEYSNSFRTKQRFAHISAIQEKQLKY